jgi:hypothetical protein
MTHEDLEPIASHLFNSIRFGTTAKLLGLNAPDSINFILQPCFVDNQPAFTIAAVEPADDGNGSYIRPLFVTTTHTMKLTNLDGAIANTRGDGIPDSIYNMLHPESVNADENHFDEDPPELQGD